MRAITCLLALALALLTLPTAHARTRLESGKPVKGSLDMTVDEASARFAITVPRDAITLRVVVSDCAATLTLRGWHEDWDEEEAAEGAENILLITRATEITLEAGTFLIDLTYVDIAPSYRGKAMRSLPFTLTATLVSGAASTPVAIGASVTGRVVDDGHWARCFAIDVAPTDEAIRVDLVSDADLDVVLKHGRPTIALEDADAGIQTPASREFFVLDKTSSPPIKPGTWYVTVADPSGTDTARFTLHVTRGRQAPAALRKLPDLPAARDDRARALLGCVELSTGNSGGSGTLVSPRGLVLTNHHVISDVLPGLAREGRRFLANRITAALAHKAGRLDELIVGVTLDPRRPTVETFRAQVLAHNARNDMALVRITSGYYGQPLPKTYRFPTVPLGDPRSLRHGDPLRFVGFPGIASLRTRPTVTLTRGIVAGFEVDDTGKTRIRSDGLISGGNSGGSALDARWRLVGIPTMTTDEGGAESFAYAFSIADLPPAWRTLIDNENK